MTRLVARDLGLLSLGFSAVFAVAALYGLVAAVVFTFAATPIGALIAFAVAAHGEPTADDERCARVDQELDARYRLRVVRTVHAEPQATVTDLTSRRPVA